MNGRRAFAVRLTRVATGGAGEPRGGNREFHVSRRCRQRYGFDQALFNKRGDVVFADYHAVRRFARCMNQQRDLAAFPERAVRAGELNAMGLIDEILHEVARLYREQVGDRVLSRALAFLEGRLGRGATDDCLARFVAEFPPLAVHGGQLDPSAWLAAEEGGEPAREAALEEMVMLWLANANPAFSPFRELFADDDLPPAYRDAVAALAEFFRGEPPFGPDRQSLPEMLRAPALAAPHSLPGQLQFIRDRWGLLLGRRLFYRLLGGFDLIREEERPAFAGAPFTPLVDRAALAAAAGEEDTERFSPDRDWMPNLVLMAKSAYVWLDQLTRIHGRPIRTLDAIPDGELDRLARWGVSGLWLIGIWERSPASRRIKRMCGNPEAMASAYSLHRYDIASDLGGDAALDDLRSRAATRGIRLAADMVPNHMGLDSPWVVEHPEWFIQLDHAPYPAYAYTGADLSPDGRVAIQIEDRYYDRGDAAVVFRWSRRDRREVRYIYHGNDGTRMPWNDTAQLNFLLPEVREAVIQTILQVARRFPIIRFDAAMTLTKRHYQRLWFPQPGAGGDIPSRAGQGLDKAEFDRRMPEEFWRQVVERVAAEAPDTLLLAEAFWLMEGFFVRNLGMHRVYNSAFMNFLKAEENAKFRHALRAVLEFNPEILKRYVNFMNNPDEETAVAQFGRGDKYFGVCTLMVTLPGLPMFGHGQVEGFEEKYGMEYARAYREEPADEDLVRRHEREIFPLLHRRALFAGVENFRLYDFFAESGEVNENVVAFTNRRGAERGLVVFHNRYESTSGWLRLSAAYAVPGSGTLHRQDLAGALALAGGAGRFVVLRDLRSGLEHLHRQDELRRNGLHLQLNAFGLRVFAEIREVDENAEGAYGRLCDLLAGQGVPRIEEALAQLAHENVRGALRALLGHAVAAWNGWLDHGFREDDPRLPELRGSWQRLQDEIRAQGKAAGGEREWLRLTGDLGAAAAWLRPGRSSGEAEGPPGYDSLRLFLGRADRPPVMLLWLLLRHLGSIPGNGASPALSLVDEWRLAPQLEESLAAAGCDPGRARTVRALLSLPPLRSGEPLAAQVESWLHDAELRSFLGINRHQDILWFNREAFSELTAWASFRAWIDGLPGAAPKRLTRVWNRLVRAAEFSAFQVDLLLKGVQVLDREIPAPRRPH